MKGVYAYEGIEDGKITTIMCGVHGDEVSGIKALDVLRNNIQVKRGKVYFIYANLKAIELSVRLTEKNMNRCFHAQIIGNSYEEQRAKEVLPYLQDSDYLLDIHNTLNKKTTPFLISEHKEVNDLFDVPYIISGLDELHPGGSDGFMNSIGKVGLCLECGYKDDSEGVNFAYNQIINFLRYTGNIEGDIISGFTGISIHCENIYHADTNTFHFSKLYGDFDEVHKGELIALDNGKEIRAERDGLMLFPNNSKTNLTEQFVFTTVN